MLQSRTDLSSSLFSLFIAVACIAPLAVGADQATEPHWIWAPVERGGIQTVQLTKTFDTTRAVQKAELRAVANFSEAAVTINGQAVAMLGHENPITVTDVTRSISNGKNQLVVIGESLDGPAAISVILRLVYDDGTTQLVISDSTWTTRVIRHPSQKPDVLAPAADFGPLEDEPWGNWPNDIPISPFDDYTQWKQAIGTPKGADPSAFKLLPGFEIQLVRSATKQEDSWVGCAFDPKGRIIIAKEKVGLLRMTLSVDGKNVSKVETVNSNLKECRGILFAHGHLFVNANNSKGLYRLTDSNGDDQFDQVKLLYESGGGVGHGRNDLALGPDGLIYSIHGDSVQLPDPDQVAYLPATTYLPAHFHKHKWTFKANHGHVIRMDKEGKQQSIVCDGLRNPFGIDFNPDGEMFTYDADAEFDMGTPWYRPTRVRHLVSGADYGWRAVTRRWPSYFHDHQENSPNTLDIGKGSPTGVRFGTKSNYPQRFKKALYILDWAYGRIIAVHLRPRGASYVGRAQTFVKGRPFNVTNLDFGPDGAMYVTTGGRQTKSALYRIAYVGPKTSPPAPTKQQIARKEYSAKLRKQRRQLESYLDRNDAAISEKIWSGLNSSDRWIRHAARIALEKQPVGSWAKQAAEARSGDRWNQARLALARAADTKQMPQLIESTIELLRVRQADPTLLYILELTMARAETPAEPLVNRVRARLDSLYPAPIDESNRILCRLLVQLGSNRVVRKTLNLIAATSNQHLQMYYLYSLRQAKEGWTMDQRRAYFQAINQMRWYQGGAGMPGFIKKIKDDAIANLTKQQRTELASVLETPKAAALAPQQKRKFVKQWKLEHLPQLQEKGAKVAEFKRGKAMFDAACIQCHRMGIQGAAIGPDLTNLGSRFSRKDILTSILAPSNVVSEKYRNVKVTTADGQVLVGRVDLSGDYRSPILRLVTNPLQPDQVTKIPKKEIVGHEASSMSPMPTGLLDTMNAAEIHDLLSYLEASGLSEHPIYKGSK